MACDSLLTTSLLLSDLLQVDCQNFLSLCCSCCNRPVKLTTNNKSVAFLAVHEAALPYNICIQLFMGEDGLKEKVRQRKFEKNA